MAEANVSLIETAARATVVVARETTWRAFPSVWGSMLDEVYAVVRAAEVDRAGRGEDRWQNVMLYKDDVPNVEVGVLAAGPFSGAGNGSRQCCRPGWRLSPHTEDLTPGSTWLIVLFVTGAPRAVVKSQGRGGRYTDTGGRIRASWRPRCTTSSAEGRRAA